jgi:pyrimidine-nucleoside phosphorylase
VTGPLELTELCLDSRGKMLVLGGVAGNEGDGRWQAEQALSSGAALRVFERWVEAQGGDPRIATDTSLLPRANLTREVTAAEGGFVSPWMPRGRRAAMMLGAGRATKDDEIDPGAGLWLDVRIGTKIEQGDRLPTLYAATNASWTRVRQRLQGLHRPSDRTG